MRGSYILTQPKDMFQSFQEQDWIYMDREFYRMQGEGNAILPYVSAAMYGPPERCFGHEVTEIPGGTIYKEKNIYLHGSQEPFTISMDMKHLRISYWT